LIWITLGYKRGKVILSISAQMYPSYNTAVLRTSTQSLLLENALLTYFMVIYRRQPPAVAKGKRLYRKQPAGFLYQCLIKLAADLQIYTDNLRTCAYKSKGAVSYY